MWFRALVAVAPLVAAMGVGGVAQAGRAAPQPQISPANGAVITSSSVTVRVKSAPGGGTLYVDGVPVDAGKNKILQYTINGRTTANGTHRVRLEATSGLWWDAASSTFQMKVPASAPSGVTASASGNKVTVRWQKGSEPDLTGYTLSGDLGTRNVSAGSCGAQCSVTLKASAGGQATIQVVAKRSGAAPSGAATRTVRLKGTAAQPQAPGNGNAPVPGPGPSYAPPPGTGQNPVFPTVAPNPPGFSTENPEVTMVYPTPTDPAVLDPSVVSMDNTGLTDTLADESLQWGKSVAIALVLLLCAAHLGAWTRSLRAVKATGPGGVRVAPGSAHARVEANRLHIEAALLAAKGTLEESPGSEEAGSGRKSRRFKKRKHKPSSPEPAEANFEPAVSTVEPDQDFPDELNLEYTPKNLDLADKAGGEPVADLDETSVDLGTSAPFDEIDDEPSSDTTILDGRPKGPEGTGKPDGEGADAALAALIELAKTDAPVETSVEEPGDRTEVLEHPRRRRGLFRR